MAEAERPRLLDQAPLWHAVLYRLGPDHHVLGLYIHHLIFDGWSHGVLHDEFVRCLRGAIGGRPPRLPALPLQIGDFASWERDRRDPDAEAWWRENLRDLPALCSTPAVGGRFVTRTMPAVAAATVEGLRLLADQYGVGFSWALLATLVATRRHAVGDDVVIGVTRASRERPELRRIVGPLLDHVPVRVHAPAGTTVGALLARVHDAYRQATARQLPLGLVRQVTPDDLTGRGGRLFDTRFNYMPATSSPTVTIESPAGALRLAPRAIEPALLAPRHTEDHPEVLPLSYILRRQADGQLVGEVCGHDGVYPASVLDALAADLAGTLAWLVEGGPDRRLPATGLAS